VLAFYVLYFYYNEKRGAKMFATPEDFLHRLLEDFKGDQICDGISANRIAERLYHLSKIGFTKEGGSNRPGYSAEEKQAKELVKSWMSEAGLKIREDGAGNVFGRLDGINSQYQPIASGSHVDSVPNGGHFDGPLGVLAALEVAQAWKDTGYQPARPYEVVIFSDEEGARLIAV
jgi:allantoate deiminase